MSPKAKQASGNLVQAKREEPASCWEKGPMSDTSMGSGSSSSDSVPPTEQKSGPSENLAQFVSDAVFGYLRAKLGLREEDKREILLTEEHGRRVLGKSLDALQPTLSSLIYVVYAVLGVDLDTSEDVALQTASDVMAALKKPGAWWRPKVQRETLMECLKFAFKDVGYLSEAPERLRSYILRCWDAYRDKPSTYKASFVTVVQSSGAGKSRLLLELARLGAGGKSVVKVLYTCTRPNDLVGFPTSTAKLQDWLFAAGQDEKKICDHLVAIYFYAQENWSSVGADWLALFTETEADKDVRDELEVAEAKRKANQDEQKPLTASRKNGVVVVAVDEAKPLLIMETKAINYYRLFRRALVLANEAIWREGFTGGIFGVLVDTNSNVSDFAPPLAQDPSSRVDPERPLYAFPPFVFADMVDIFWKKIMSQRCKGYEGAVGSSDIVAWDALVSMGRPLWWSTFRALIDPRQPIPATRESATEHVISLAASKLLRGLDPRIEASFNESTMFGVASLLCRLGIRPYCTSALASHVVADFMAVLAYVNHENVSRLSTYTSDPVLSFGATHLWYVWSSGKASSLSKFILPQFKKLILNETVDTGGVGEAVARIVLLLAIDSCVVEKVGKERSMCQFMGQFVSVLSFLELLGDPLDDMQLKEKGPQGTGMVETSKDVKAKLSEWLPKWTNWQMGFSHFVQLSLEPTEETLWFLLGRRAAGMLARGANGADLIIPIFRASEKHGGKSEISMILVQVKNRERDGEFPASATSKMSSAFVFNKRNKLSQMPDLSTIRVYMSLHEKPERFFCCPNQPVTAWEASAPRASESQTVGEDVPPPTPTDSTSPELFTFCLRSLDACTFIDAPVLEQLVDIALPLWDPEALIKADLRHRKVMKELSERTKVPSAEVVTDEELEAVARCALLPVPGLAKAKRGEATDEEEKAIVRSGETGASAKKRKRKKRKRKIGAKV